MLYNVWVLYATFKFGWTTQDNGWSLAAVGVMSVIVQGWLLGKLLKRYPPRRLAVLGLASSTLAFLAWGAASQGWMMYAVIVANVFGYTINAAVQSMVSVTRSARAGASFGPSSRSRWRRRTRWRSAGSMRHGCSPRSRRSPRCC